MSDFPTTLKELLAKIGTPGWDWPQDEYAWLSSESGLWREDADGSGTSIFFIHGGRIREQAYLPYGSHDPDKFCELIKQRTKGLDSPTVNWLSDTGGGDPGLWVEGTRLPNEDDMRRLLAAWEKQKRDDERALRAIRARGNLVP